jgi:hypothetical protein
VVGFTGGDEPPDSGELVGGHALVGEEEEFVLGGEVVLDESDREAGFAGDGGHGGGVEAGLGDHALDRCGDLGAAEVVVGGPWHP